MKRWLLYLILLGLPCTSLMAQSNKSGISASRLKLPAGPGSLEGTGEDAEVNLNMGTVTYAVPMHLPEGFSKFSPSLSLQYASSAGASEIGIGWSMSIQKIERMTARGLPSYNAEDTFVASGGTELVKVEEGEGSHTYRARFEGGFVQYHWVDEEGFGKTGYWMAQLPNGSLAFFGANADGNLVPEARIEGADKEGAPATFCYLLVEQRDVHGHRIVYNYENHDARPYLSEVQWVFSEQGVPRYTAELLYEDRPDTLSDAKPGREVRLTKRLSNVIVRVRGVQLRRVHLEYENQDTTGGISRLTRVTNFGLNDEGPYPIAFEFDYTGSFDPTCENAQACTRPILQPLGNTPFRFQNSTVDLIDINGDLLPDLVDTREGNHQIQLMEIGENGFALGAAEQSQTVGLGGPSLASPDVYLVDLNGNGYSELVDRGNGRVLENLGRGDWTDDKQVPNLNFEMPEVRDDSNTRFFDVNNDHLIDVIHIGNGAAWWKQSLGGERFADRADDLFDLAELGLGFVENNLKLADMNGDGMLDLIVPPIQGQGSVTWYLNLGWGRFDRARQMFGFPEQWGARENSIFFVDLNGDSLTDAVQIFGSEVQYVLNRSGQAFSERVRLSELEGGEQVPERFPGDTIRFADFNGSGSRDVLYFKEGGQVHGLDVVPRRPNLLSRVQNGIGKVVEFSYGTTIDHMMRDGGAQDWRHRLPHPMLVLDRIESYDTLSGIRDIQRMHYRHGFYDGLEKQFRGFEEVEVFHEGDDSIEDSLVVHLFDVGQLDRYRHGLLLANETRIDDQPLLATEHTYEDCSVEGIGNNAALTHPIRFVCKTSTDTVLQEGRPEGDWITKREESEYDGYGNIVLAAKLGVVNAGGQACAPCGENWDPNIQAGACGPQCLGDEIFEETAFIEPSAETTQGKWILRAPFRKRNFNRAESREVMEQLTYYDGEAFEGLPLGRLTHGLATRATNKKEAGSDEVITPQRFQFDRHGNVIASLDALGFEKQFSYDEEGLLLLTEEILFGDVGNHVQNPYSLRMRVAYHSVLESPVETYDWERLEAGQVVSVPKITRTAYDAFGRIIAMAKPGDLLESPTEVYGYELGDPVSRIVAQSRSTQGGPLDIEVVQCLDGKGRKTQTITKIDEGEFQVSGFSLFNSKGENYRVYQPYLKNNHDCEARVPEGVLFTEANFDGIGRPLTTILPDAEDFAGIASETRNLYGPLWTQTFDVEDTSIESPHFNTPHTTYTDGLDRTLQMERLLAPDAAPITVAFTYDALGRVRSQIDHDGNEKVQHYDLLGRVVRIEDPNSGINRIEYNDRGDTVREVDGRGIAVVQRFDEGGRILEYFKEGAREETLIEWSYDKLDEAVCATDVCTNLEGKPAMVTFPLLSGERNADVYGYDARGQSVFAETRRRDHAFSFRYTYDNAGRVTETLYPGDLIVMQEYDGASRVRSIPDFVDEVVYDDRSLMSGLSLANGTHTDHTYDASMRLAELSTRSAQGPPLLSLQYERNRVGHLLAIEDRRAELAEDLALASANAAYEYDAFYRLTAARLEEGREKEETLRYRFGPTENLLEKISSLGVRSAGHVGVLSYGEGLLQGGEGSAGPHAAIQAGQKRFSYDDAGHVIRQENLAHLWDHRSRISETRRDENTILEYAYDEGGERTVKIEEGRRTDYFTKDFELRDGILSLNVFLGDSRIAKLESTVLAAEVLPDLSPAREEGNGAISEPDGRISVSDAWVFHAHEQGFLDVQNAEDFTGPTHRSEELLHTASKALLLEAAQELREAQAAGQVPNEGEPKQAITYFHPDHQGSTTLSTNEQGNELQRSFHFPYGDVRNQTAQLPDYSYTGQERDLPTGLSYHSARYLHTNATRWISPDPYFMAIGKHTFEKLWESVNPYAYVVGNPINYTDPTGNWPTPDTIWDIGSAIYNGVGAAYHCIGGTDSCGEYTVGFLADLGGIAAPIGTGFGSAAKVAYRASKKTKKIKSAAKIRKINQTKKVKKAKTNKSNNEIELDSRVKNTNSKKRAKKDSKGKHGGGTKLINSISRETQKKYNLTEKQIRQIRKGFEKHKKQQGRGGKDNMGYDAIKDYFEESAEVYMKH